MNSIKELTPQQLRHAADVQERILSLQHELDQLFNSGSPRRAYAAGGKRKLSRQGAANIRAAAVKRWAKFRAEHGGGPVRRKRKMSAAARRSISAQLKARWAAAKRSGRNAL